MLAALLWAATAPPRVEAVQSDLSFISDSTWTADPAAARVHVLAVVTATSHTVDSDTRRLYYDRVQLTLPPDSAAFVATSGNRSLPITIQSTTPSGVIVVVGLGSRLYSGQSGSFVLQFDLVDSGGSTDRDFRIGHNLMSFPVWAFGSPGTPGSTVTVIFPSYFNVQEEFGGLTRAVYGSGEVVFTSGVIDDSTELSAWFTAVQPVPPGDYRIRTVAIGPLSVDLRYWVDDVAWADQVERVLRLGYPVLRDSIGLGDAVGTKLTVEEASTQAIAGFSGSFDQSNGRILISYFADPFVILHEAAHMWLNSNLLSDRWVEEGFASYYAQQAVDKLGLVDHAPILTDRMLQAAVPLDDWAAAGEPSSATDAYLYGASLEVARQIAAEAGQDGLRSVWAAARSDLAAYQPLHGQQIETVQGGPADSRRLLDLLEQMTGHSYSVLWRAWVLAPSQSSLLDQRGNALAAYSEARAAAGAWNLPPEIRRSLDGWQYGRAMDLIAQARGVLAQHDQIVSMAHTEQTTPPPTLRNTFEQSDLASASAEATSELAVLEEMAAARQAQTDSGGAARALGLLGTDPQANLASARDAFAKGDLKRAMSLATSARTAWQGANGAGQVRIFGSLCVLAGGLMLLALFTWGRSGGRGGILAIIRAAGVATDAASDAASDAPTPSEGALPASGTTEGRRRRTARAGVTNRRRDGSSHGSTDSSPADSTPQATAGPAPRRGRKSVDGDAGVAVDHDEVDSHESAFELLKRGHALLHERHNAQAAVVLERAARIETSKGSILEALGRAYFNSGQHARAADTFEALLEVDPSAPYGHFGLGLSFARLGRRQDAKTHLRMAAALDPASETYRRALDKIEATES